MLDALTEYFKASGVYSALMAALDIAEVVSEKTRDTSTDVGGFYEDFTRDWTLLVNGTGPLGTMGLKNSNAILHLVSAGPSSSPKQPPSTLGDVNSHRADLFTALSVLHKALFQWKIVGSSGLLIKKLGQFLVGFDNSVMGALNIGYWRVLAA